MPPSVPVNKSIVEVMKLPRAERRRIARLNGLKNIPSINNVTLKRVSAEKIKEMKCTHGHEDPSKCITCLEAGVEKEPIE